MLNANFKKRVKKKKFSMVVGPRLNLKNSTLEFLLPRL